MKPVKNTVSESVLKAIPETAKDRRIFLKKRLSRYKDAHVQCPALGVMVKIDQHSITEIAENACLSKKSTIAALNLEPLIRNAVWERMSVPESKTQKKKFAAIFVYVLKAELEKYGKVKILVTVSEYKGFLYYSVSIPSE